jgi:opacity protein-like surface antigen
MGTGKLGFGKRVWLGGLILALSISFVTMETRRARAVEHADLAAGIGVMATLGVAMIGYGIYETQFRPGQPRLIPGEFYVSGYLGGGGTPNQDLEYQNGLKIQNGTLVTHQGATTLMNTRFQPGVVGGIKFGYFFDNPIPYLGLEIEMNYNRSAVRYQSVTASPAVQGFRTVNLDNDNWVNWTTAFHIIGRYGFLPDAEVPFGRLQPYVGVGPGWVCMYDSDDAAKNFSLDVMCGVRYMMLKNVSAYIEYKFSHQWDAEMELHKFSLPNGASANGTATLNYDSHKVVLGVAYHF